MYDTFCNLTNRISLQYFQEKTNQSEEIETLKGKLENANEEICTIKTEKVSIRWFSQGSNNHILMSC